MQGQGLDPYRNAWAQISGLLSSGTSWSGHEHNSAWIHLGEGIFQDISDTSGMAFDADGRGVVRVDWDGDGDLDLWIRSRSAPGLRYME
ncbi:MAG: VCBS repeat-containing protein, partial [Planctomycetes bacterium]|nr:VCBS repeat-containing protein [Planctomycetota bacterium]